MKNITEGFKWKQQRTLHINHWRIQGAPPAAPFNGIQFFRFHIYAFLPKSAVSEVGAPPMAWHPPNGKSLIRHKAKNDQCMSLCITISFSFVSTERLLLWERKIRMDSVPILAGAGAPLKSMVSIFAPANAPAQAQCKRSFLLQSGPLLGKRPPVMQILSRLES